MIRLLPGYQGIGDPTTNYGFGVFVTAKLIRGSGECRVNLRLKWWTTHYKFCRTGKNYDCYI